MNQKSIHVQLHSHVMGQKSKSDIYLHAWLKCAQNLSATKRFASTIKIQVNIYSKNDISFVSGIKEWWVFFCLFIEEIFRGNWRVFQEQQKKNIVWHIDGGGERGNKKNWNITYLLAARGKDKEGREWHLICLYGGSSTKLKWQHGYNNDNNTTQCGRGNSVDIFRVQNM